MFHYLYYLVCVTAKSTFTFCSLDTAFYLVILKSSPLSRNVSREITMVDICVIIHALCKLFSLCIKDIKQNLRFVSNIGFGSEWYSVLPSLTNCSCSCTY